MKKIISWLFCVFFCYASFCQNIPSKELTTENYLHKSKVKKNIGLSFLGAGVALFITGGIIDNVKRPELLAGFGYEIIGITSAVISIPFFLSSSKNKRKAMMITLGQQKSLLLRQNVTFQPNLTLKIRL